jgi:hypothetical protein
MHTKFWPGNLKGRHHSTDVDTWAPAGGKTRHLPRPDFSKIQNLSKKELYQIID